MFQLKDFASIAASMINHAKATQKSLTDFTVGSVSRTLIEAPAIEIDEFYQRMFAGIMDAIPVAIYKGFDFAVGESAIARGVVTVTFGGVITTAFTIPAGTVFVSPSTDKKYLTVDDTPVLVGSTSIALSVNAAIEGLTGNIDAGTITESQGYTLPTGSTITNDAILSGRDAETELERKTRFMAYIQTLARGTNGAVKYAASTAVIRNGQGQVIEYADRIGFIEVPGTMDVYMYGRGVAPSQDLLDEAQKIIDGYPDANGILVPGYRPVGIRVRVFPMVQQQIPVTAIVKLFQGYTGNSTMTGKIETALTTLMMSILAGEILYAAVIIDTILAITGVEEVILSTNTNVTCLANQVLVPGAITITYI